MECSHLLVFGGSGEQICIMDVSFQYQQFLHSIPDISRIVVLSKKRKFHLYRSGFVII